MLIVLIRGCGQYMMEWHGTYRTKSDSADNEEFAVIQGKMLLG